ncbi:ATP-binding cassette domain-containing protein [Patescibacteria group bacterium]|nr:ATP-binding cassette domain-containing protein [Patescibacteria group bacterium]
MGSMISLLVAGDATVGDLVLVQSFLAIAFTKLEYIGRLLRRGSEAATQIAEALDVMDRVPEIQDVPNAKKLRVTKGEIVFSDASFGYLDEAMIRALNLTIASKERIGLVGPSGAGKSTLTKLLLRFYDVQSGEIRIDGQNISEVTQESLRKSIAYVSQEPVLFHRSLYENIAYGKPGASMKEVIAAAKKAHCHEFITALPEGYESTVGERGVKLSGGERQRVAIARAILKDAPILMLDEATSSLDSESEALIQDALSSLMRDKTVIVIAHRLSTIMQMDRIIVIEQGGITDTGTHNELLKKVGMYQKLWGIQAGSFQTT